MVNNTLDAYTDKKYIPMFWVIKKCPKTVLLNFSHVHLMKKSNYQEQLTVCYNTQAKHFSHTRKKFWPEMEYIIQTIEQTQNKKKLASILELGCGDGRLYGYLQTLLQTTHYTGIDIATAMITLATEQYPSAIRQVAEMNNYLALQNNESFDCILGMASVQHIFGPEDRALFFAHAYRTLSRWGSMILSNRSYSERFLKKYRKQLLKTLPKLLIEKKRVRNDSIIPRKDPNIQNNHISYDRYYHLFTLYELQQHALHAWFVIRELHYIAQDGSKTYDRRTSRNSFLVIEKAIV